MGQKSLKTEKISCTGCSELTTETDSAETTQQGLLWSRLGVTGATPSGNDHLQPAI